MALLTLNLDLALLEPAKKNSRFASGLKCVAKAEIGLARACQRLKCFAQAFSGRKEEFRVCVRGRCPRGTFQPGFDL